MKSKIVALSTNQNFKNLLKEKKISNKYLTIYFGKLSNKDNKKLNIGFVVKKKLGNAVIRNKIKRRLRNIMNEAYKKIDINLNYSYLLVAKKMIFDDKYENVKKTLLTDFCKIK